jgi:hypothetical protein
MFIPPNEKIIETKKCRISGEEFVVTNKDVEFYNALSPVFGGVRCPIPTPTLCPRERQMRRMVWRNYDQFYRNICVLTGKEIISTYRPWTPYKVVSLESWWSDNWNPCDYWKKIDFSRPFFSQFHELDQAVLHMPLSISKSENSTFTNFSIHNRNCYLCTRIAECENCYYCLFIVRSKNCYDCYDVGDSEYLYECIRTTQSYHSLYCTDCENCRDCFFLLDCSGCQDCFGSCNLRNKQYVFNNQQLSEETYRKKLAQTLDSTSDYINLRNNFLHFCEQFPKKFMTGFQNEDGLWNYLFSNSHVVFGFDCRENENVRYAYGGHHIRDSIDITTGYFHERSLEVCGWTATYNQLFCISCLNDCRDLLYCKDCVTATTDCFGCISLKKGKNCILNTIYSQLEYETLCLKLIDHMRSTGEWWEFFPAEYSSYAYNETTAQSHFPQTKEFILNRKWSWYESEKAEKTMWFIPLTIDQYDEKKVGFETAQKNIDTLLASTLVCVESGKQFKLVPQELAYYIENSLPITRLHHSVRSAIRLKQTLPMELYDRNCDECWQPFFTSYAPDRLEKILCEECYRKLVY